MKWTEKPLVRGIFVERLHRFGAKVIVRGREEYCHVTNSGRLKELLFPGAQVALVDHGGRFKTQNPKSKIRRKTRYAVRLARFRKKWVCIEANIAPKLLMEAWKAGRIRDLKIYDRLKAEVPLNAHTRFDFQALDSKSGDRAWIEVKCVTLVDEKGTGRFPDAPSERASKHLKELMALSRKSRTKCFVFFVLQNPFGRAVAAKRDTDPLFAGMMDKAMRSKVVLKAFRAEVDLKGSRIIQPIPVLKS